MKKVLVLCLTIALIFSFAHNTVFAQNATGSAKRAEIQKRIEQRRQEMKERQASRAAGRKAKLDRVKLRICETKQENIIRRSNRIADRADRQFNVFEEIAQRVDTFYQNRLVPKGLTVENYEQLKADIQTQKDEVKTLIETAQGLAKAFDCAGEDPKGQLTDFRESMRAAIAALKDYRTTIKNFIGAVRDANANSEATESAGN